METSLLVAERPARTSFGREADAYVQGPRAQRRPRSSNSEFPTSGSRAGTASSTEAVPPAIQPPDTDAKGTRVGENNRLFGLRTANSWDHPPPWMGKISSSPVPAEIGLDYGWPVPPVRRFRSCVRSLAHKVSTLRFRSHSRRPRHDQTVDVRRTEVRYRSMLAARGQHAVSTTWNGGCLVTPFLGVWRPMKFQSNHATLVS